jgi:hypothetical protein
MIGFGSPVEIKLDAGRFRDDEETLVVAEVVARHAEKRRKQYRATEQPIKVGLLAIEGYWSDSVPWYEWMTEPQILQPCAKECGLPIYELANVIAYQIRPINWQVFSWMATALHGQEYEEIILNSLSKHATMLAEMRERQRTQAIEAGRESAKVRRESVRCTPDEVAREYQTLMATGTEERNIAAKLATRFNVTSNHIRKLRKQAEN